MKSPEQRVKDGAKAVPDLWATWQTQSVEGARLCDAVNESGV